MTTEVKCKLMDLVGGEGESGAEMEFIILLQEALASSGEELTPSAYRLVLRAWKLGYWSCHGLFFKALKEGRINISFTDKNGDEWRFKPSK